ncbi:hypothetical protein [Caldithrix abyssi]
MRMGHIFIYLALGALISGQGLFAQDDEFQKWLEKDQAQFKQFVEQEDKDFAEFLKKDWQAFLTEQGLKTFSRPKPPKMPVAREEDKPKPQVPVKKIEELPPPPPKPVVKPKPRPLPRPQKQAITVNFYGARLNFPAVRLKSINLKSPLTSEKISQAWLAMAATDYKPLVSALQQTQKQLLLNDWAFLELIDKAVRKNFANDPNICTAYNWFLLNKLGYDAKVAFKADKLFLLMPSKNTIFEQPFVKINNQRYYFISLNERLNLSGKIRTYRGTFKNADQPLRLTLNRLPVFAITPGEKAMHFTFNGKQYQLSAQYDVQLVRFLENYPQTDLTVYFAAPVSGELNYSLLTQLRPMVQGKSELEAVNLLLRFVQTAFNYQTDDRQFGREKCLLPDETLYYPASDCEDRSVLFAFLVRHLLGLEIIGLDYPNHIATAVCFNSQIPGAAVEYKGKRFVICDPTYINADAGMVMPDFKDVNPKIIELK